MNTLLKIGLVAGTALALCACDPGQPSAAPSGPSRSSAAPPGTPATSPTTSPAASPANPAPSINPCPVGEQTLLKALTGTAIARDAGTPVKLTGITCYNGYAIARDGGPPGPGDRASYLFGFRRPQNVWIALSAGTADICERYVLDRNTREHLGNGC